MADLSKVMQREQLHSEHAAVSYLEARRRERERQKHAALTLAAFDALGHAGRQEASERRAETERAARNRL